MPLLINRGFIALGKYVYVSMRGHIRILYIMIISYLKKKETGKSTSERAGLETEYIIYTAKYR
jgi:hypothetical protein